MKTITALYEAAEWVSDATKTSKKMSLEDHDITNAVVKHGVLVGILALSKVLEDGIGDLVEALASLEDTIHKKGVK
jgi:hypothetical protein